MTETSFEVEEISPRDNEREGLEPEVRIEVRYMQPGDEAAVLNLIDAAVQRTHVLVGRSLDANDKEK